MPPPIGTGGIMFPGCPSVWSLKYPLLNCTWVRWSTRPTVTVLRHVHPQSMGLWCWELMNHPDPAVLPVDTLHSLEWFWVSRRIFVYSHHNTIVFFSKMSVRPERFPGICRRMSGGNGLKFYMLMYLDRLQNWLVYGHCLLIFLILTLLWLSETGQIWGFRSFPGKHMEEMAWNFCTLMYLDRLQNWLVYGHSLLFFYPRPAYGTCCFGGRLTMTFMVKFNSLTS